jgi:hypothetical protein
MSYNLRMHYVISPQVELFQELVHSNVAWSGIKWRHVVIFILLLDHAFQSTHFFNLYGVSIGVFLPVRHRRRKIITLNAGKLINVFTILHRLSDI